MFHVEGRGVGRAVSRSRRCSPWAESISLMKRFPVFSTFTKGHRTTKATAYVSQQFTLQVSFAIDNSVMFFTIMDLGGEFRRGLYVPPIGLLPPLSFIRVSGNNLVIRRGSHYFNSH